MPALPSWLIEPIWEQFSALLPQRHDRHPPAVAGPGSVTGWSSNCWSTSWSSAPGTGAMVTVAARRPRCGDAAMSGSALGL